jgi:hypothetical protein
MPFHQPWPVLITTFLVSTFLLSVYLLCSFIPAAFSFFPAMSKTPAWATNQPCRAAFLTSCGFRLVRACVSPCACVRSALCVRAFRLVSCVPSCACLRSVLCVRSFVPPCYLSIPFRLAYLFSTTSFHSLS